ncbi:MAG: uracil-DNA glycosylase, partial [Wolbachia sp.]
MSDKDLELLKFYHEIGVDCTLTEGEEVENEEISNPIHSPIIKQKKEQQTMFPSDWIIEAR